MGLDMYAFAIPAAAAGDKQVDLRTEEGVEPEKLHYWRKHHDLHGWMEKLYREKGGTDPDFNCNSVRLDAADLDKLEKAIKEENAVLPVTTGFFFGNNPPNEETRADDMAFINDARRAIADGKVVLYDSWW